MLDSVIDRYGEAAIFLSLACYYLFNSLDEIAVLLCIISMLCSQLISYVRAKSESLDIENKSGFLTRVERSLIIIFFLLISQPLFALYILSVGTFLVQFEINYGLKMLKISFLSSLFLVLLSSGIQVTESNEDFIVNEIDHKVDFPNNISFFFEGLVKKISDIKSI